MLNHTKAKELSLDQLMSAIQENRREGETLKQAFDQIKQERSVLLAELDHRGLRVSADFFSSRVPMPQGLDEDTSFTPRDLEQLI